VCHQLDNRKPELDENRLFKILVWRGREDIIVRTASSLAYPLWICHLLPTKASPKRIMVIAR
jgi:hypothetical protein